MKEYRRVIGTAAHVMLADRLPAKDVVLFPPGVSSPKTVDGVNVTTLAFSRRGDGTIIPAVGVAKAGGEGTIVVWIHPDGKRSLWQDGKLVPAARKIVDQGARILAIDVFGTGEQDVGKLPPVNPNYAGYTFGYNRSVPAYRTRDILTAVGFARVGGLPVHLVGWEKAGPWVLLARSLCGDAVSRTAADMNQFRFDKINATSDEMMLPGAAKYGGLPALTALAAPHPLFIHNSSGTDAERLADTGVPGGRREGPLDAVRREDGAGKGRGMAAALAGRLAATREGSAGVSRNDIGSDNETPALPCRVAAKPLAM